MLMFLLEFGVSRKISHELILPLGPFLWRGPELLVKRLSELTIFVRQYDLPDEVYDAGDDLGRGSDLQLNQSGHFQDAQSAHALHASSALRRRRGMQNRSGR